MTDTLQENKIDYKRVIIFLLIAISLSNIFRFDIFELYPILEKLPKWIYLLVTTILEGSGVLIGALLALRLLRKKRVVEFSLWGTSKINGMLMASIPLVLLAIIGVNNKYDMNSHLYGLIAGFGTLLYCIMEEYGWRGYLQEEFKALKPLIRFLLIGFIWYFWHLSFLTNASLNQNLYFLVMLIFGSWGIGKIAELTKSVLASACFHLIVNFFMYNELISKGIDSRATIIIVSVSIVLWIFILRIWDKKNIV
jgi:uncharacterized protein